MGGARTKKADGSVVLVTGCSDGGIGSSLAMNFAEAGYLVVATARSLNSMTQLDQYPGIQTMVLAITNFEAVKAIVQSIEQEYGRIDILVNNAEVSLYAPVAEVPLTALESTYRTNVCGTVSLTQAVIPTMIAKGKGKIVNIGSITSYSYGPWSARYSSSKAVIHCLTDALRLELKPFGLHVMLVLPGAIKSNLSKNSEVSIFDDLNFYQSWKSTLIRRVNLSQTAHTTLT